jgi:hypothetical protein
MRAEEIVEGARAAQQRRAGRADSSEYASRANRLDQLATDIFLRDFQRRTGWFDL